MADKHPGLVADSLLAENIFLTIGTRGILKGVTIRADRGKVTGLVGRNGAGKSTMLQAMFGSRRAQECDVFLNGAKVACAFAVPHLVNYLPQKPFLPRQLSIRKIAAQFEVDLEQMEYWLPGSMEGIDRPIKELSGGMERLYSVVIVVLAKTRFSLLDEPFTHIMPLHVEGLKAMIAHQKQNKGIIITDHLYRPLLDLSDQLYLMKEGRSVYVRDMEQLVVHGYLLHPGI